MSNLGSSLVRNLTHQRIPHLNFLFNSPGEAPPPRPRALFGREELIEKIVGLVDSLTPIALIGAGGIGKTSIALTVLHHDRIKERFGDNRRFIRCDQFPATHTHFLHRLSKVIGAGAENPKGLAPLRSFLSSKEMLIILDNAESILDTHGANAQELYDTVKELGQFDNICLCITSRISAIPPDCEALDIPKLSVEAARSAFYRIYRNGGRSDLIDNILEQLEFHPLSVTLLATVAHQNRWDTDRLNEEWKGQRTGVLHTDRDGSLAATIELSLASPMFQKLGPDARALLEVIAFFPQGIEEKNLVWLFPTISNGKNIFDKFCALSLTHRNKGFATMLAPLRDHLRPKDPKSSMLLCAVKERYSSRLLAETDPDKPEFEETRWVVSEDVNVEHLLDIFATADTNSDEVWRACADFMRHLRWHKPRLVVLEPKIQGLPDDHPSKPRCLFYLSQLLYSVGSHAESKRLLVHTLELWRKQGDDLEVARTLELMAFVNIPLGCIAEGIQEAKEALGIYERLNNAAGQADSLQRLASLFSNDGQLDAAEEAAFRAVNLSGESRQSLVCEHHHILGHIYDSRGQTEAAINHHNISIEIASSLRSRGKQAWLLACLVDLLLKAGRFDEAQIQFESLKSHVVHEPFGPGLTTVIQAEFWYHQGKIEEAKSEALRAIDVCGKLGLSGYFLERSRKLLRKIGEQMND